MLWGCFSSQDNGNPVRIPIMRKEKSYIQILDENMNESAELYLGDYWKFHQDCDPRHTAKVVQKSFKENDISVLDGIVRVLT